MWECDTGVDCSECPGCDSGLVEEAEEAEKIRGIK